MKILFLPEVSRCVLYKPKQISFTLGKKHKMDQDTFNDIALDEATRISSNEYHLSDEEFRDILTTEVENLYYDLSKEEKRKIDIDEAIEYAIENCN